VHGLAARLAALSEVNIILTQFNIALNTIYVIVNAK
jgi:hypothetical protein